MSYTIKRNHLILKLFFTRALSSEKQGRFSVQKSTIIRQNTSYFSYQIKTSLHLSHRVASSVVFDVLVYYSTAISTVKQSSSSSQTTGQFFLKLNKESISLGLGSEMIRSEAY